MDHFMSGCFRWISLSPNLHLNTASGLRPLFLGPSSLTSFATLATVPLTSTGSTPSGCLYQEASNLLHPKFFLTAVLERLRSWRDFIKSPSTPSDDLNPMFELFSRPGHMDQTHTDYVRIAQLVISIIGIGLSLKLMLYLIEQINPTAKEKRLARKRVQQLFTNLGLKTIPQLTDYEVGIAVNLVDTQVLSTDWDSIGGLSHVIDELKESVLVPFQQVQLVPYPSRLLRAPKGVLLYGPPGCGKTMLARAMARTANASFINLQISTLVSMWYGETQKYVEATFTLAHKLQPAIIFIDELDSFLTSRSYTDNEPTRMIKTQFMALWDGLLSEENTRILIVGATNRPGDLDQAILRRLPYKVSVPLPGVDQRAQILSLRLRDEPLATGLTYDDIQEIAIRTNGLSGSDLAELCREAAFCCYRTEKLLESPANIRLRREHFLIALEQFLSNRVHSSNSRIAHPAPLD
ncbi:unnamed protein product [Dicrocoelium dendriticum]|nr:unnamed protein product [Dicrocoelium dendriticum]